MPSSSSSSHASRMTLLVLVGLCGNAIILPTNSQKPMPRRDQHYPPPASLAFYSPLSEQCIKETGVNPGTIKRFSDEDMFEDDRKLKCYMSCIFEKSNVTDAKGEVHLGKLLELVPPDFEDIMLRMGAKCTKPKGKDLCERAFWFHKCWKNSDPVHYYLI